ncbi:hypothetical protein GCM10020367_22470 [Streptomyces sannanensis]|uniref:Glycosyltransferase n=1 Tax=Streptomyces sannanensis TaxID=285536 RepID=A0ABP6S9H3_9ACTN
MKSHVLYLALGPNRVAAATEHVKELAASGSRVVLAAPDMEEWADAIGELSAVDGVEVVKLAVDGSRAPWQAARKLIGQRSGPLADAELLIAGDAQALPVAWTALRKRPGLAFRLEPYETGGRAAEPADLAVVAPWYPSPNNPYAGAFVQSAVAAVGDRFDKVALYHTEDWGGPAGPKLGDAIKVTANRFRERRDLVPVLDTPEGTLTRVPVPLVRRKGYADAVATQEAALRKALPTGRIEAPVIHAHVGIYGGVLAMRLARPDARIVVTEHATFLTRIFRQPAARRLYAEVLERADAFLCVSDSLRKRIAQEFPKYAKKLQVVPNVIDFDRFTVGGERSPELLRWLYVGRLTPHKGVSELLEAFGKVAQEEPRATLTMVGSGELEEDLLARAEELGLGDRFRVLPPVHPGDVNELMHQYDLLVHASRIETFGMTVVEAVATGLPVLVARSQGPQGTLAGIETAAGALMDVSEDPQVIVDAYHELRERAAELDLPRAREVLQSRYGVEAVAKQLMDVYEGVVPAEEQPVAQDKPAAAESAGPEAAAPAENAEKAEKAEDTPAEPVGRAVVLALTPPKPKRIADFANALVERGVEVTVVTAKTDVWAASQLDARVPVVSIEAAEKKLTVPRAERFVVYRAPRAVLRRARKVAAGRRDAIGPELAVAAAQRAHTKVANAWHKKVFNRGYREVRPQLLSRIARREALPKLDLQQIDHVFVADVNSTVTGWKWAKKHPHLTVTTNLDRETYSTKE